MASKLEYLKKYETKPTKDAEKPRKKHERAKVGSSSFSIRDVSDALPEFKEEKKRRVLPGAERARPDEEDIEVVDMDVVTEAQKIDAETSGVKWRIQNHRPGAPRQSLDSKAAPPPSKPQRHDSDDDISPPRAAAVDAGRVRHGSDVGIPPEGASASARGRARHDSDADHSPPRANSGGGGQTRHDSDADLSPPRAKSQAGARQPSISRHGHRRSDSQSDLSPPRPKGQAQRHDSDADLSPPRNTVGGAAAASAQATGRARHDSDVDLSPPRPKVDASRTANARHDSDADLSPPRNGGAGASGSAGGGVASVDGADRMASGHRSGLVQASDLKMDGKLIREKQKVALIAAPDSETGRNAETIHRSKTGAKVDRETWASEQVKQRRKKDDHPEQELEWGGGVKQKFNAEEEKKELERIAAQPFARYQPDERFLAEQKDKHDWNDPMRKMQEDEGADHQAMGSAAIAAKQKRPKCPFPAWANRFNIAPGYRWDGKVRTNGYEKKWLESKNSREFNKDQRWRNQELDVGN